MLNLLNIHLVGPFPFPLAKTSRSHIHTKGPMMSSSSNPSKSKACLPSCLYLSTWYPSSLGTEQRRPPDPPRTTASCKCPLGRPILGPRWWRYVGGTFTITQCVGSSAVTCNPARSALHSYEGRSTSKVIKFGLLEMGPEGFSHLGNCRSYMIWSCLTDILTVDLHDWP